MTRPVNLRPRYGVPRDDDGVLRITFPQPCKPINLNDRLHWATRADLTKIWRAAAGWAATGTPPQPPSTVRLVIPVRSVKVRRDPHNWAPTLKAVVDGLVDAGLWPDDTAEYVEALDAAFARGTTCTVEIQPRGAQ